RGIAKLGELEKVLKDIHGDVTRGAERPSMNRVSHDVDAIEALERADGGDHRQEEQRGRQEWEGDPPQNPPRPGAIYSGRIVDLLGDVRESREDDHHSESQGVPDGKNHDAGQSL